MLSDFQVIDKTIMSAFRHLFLSSLHSILITRRHKKNFKNIWQACKNPGPVTNNLEAIFFIKILFHYVDVALVYPLTSQYLLQIILSTMKISNLKSLAVFTRIVC